MRSARDGALALAIALGMDSAGADVEAQDGRPGPPQIAAAGPRASARADEYELLLEMILEGTRLHYGSARVLPGDDPDLALLLGDQLYALGLSRLAELGDLEAVAELADLISLLSAAQAAGDEPLVQAIWHAGAVAIGWGTTDDHEAAKALARAADPGAAQALTEAAAARLEASSVGAASFALAKLAMESAPADSTTS